MSIYEMSLDLKKSSPIYSDPIVLRQGDTNVEILVHVFDNSTPKNLENLPIEFHADKPDATTIDDDEQSHFTIGTDKESFTYTVPDELTDASGSTTNTYFKVGSDSTSNFYIHILTKAGMEKLESGDYISKVDRIFNHVMSDYSAINDLAETGKGTFDTALADSKKEIKDLMDNLNAEYVQFINSKTTDFNTSLDSLDAQATDVKNKYDALKDQLDLATQNIGGVRTNLLTGTSNQVVQANDWNMQVADIKYDKNLGKKLCASVMINNADHADVLVKGGARIYLETFDSNGNTLASVWGKYVSYNANGLSQCSISINDSTADIKAYIQTDNMNQNTFYSCLKIEKGSVATDWCPNPAEILTQSDYAKIKAAIVALGGALS